MSKISAVSNLIRKNYSNPIFQKVLYLFLMIVGNCLNWVWMPVYLMGNEIKEEENRDQKDKWMEQQSRTEVGEVEKNFERSLEAFIDETGGIGKNVMSVKYMKLSNAFCNFKPLKCQEFKKFYKKVIGKYLSYYGDERKKKSWGINDVNILLWLIHRLAVKTTLNPKEWSDQQWKQISSLIPFRQPQDCKFRWLKIRKNQLQKNPWTKQQIQILLQLLSFTPQSTNTQNNTHDWNQISQQLFLKTNIFRTPKQCRQCFNIQTNSHHQSKKLWSSQQDIILIQLYKNDGKKWRSISNKLPGRSQNAVKNRFHLLYNKGVFNDKIKEQECEQ